MKHQPFEDWLFSIEPLAPQETIALQEHLQNCASCRQLSSAWGEVEHHIRETPATSPAPGFAVRWQTRLEMDRQRLHRRQSLAMLGFSLTGTILLLGSLVLLALPLLSSPDILIWTWVYRLISLVNYAEAVRNIFAVILGAVSGRISPVWWFIFVGVLSELLVLWVVSYRLLTNPRRVSR